MGSPSNHFAWLNEPDPIFGLLSLTNFVRLVDVLLRFYPDLIQGFFQIRIRGGERQPNIAFCPKRRTGNDGDVGLILRYKSPHYAQKSDAQPNNVDLTVIELVSHAQLFGDFGQDPYFKGLSDHPHIAEVDCARLTKRREQRASGDAVEIVGTAGLWLVVAHARACLR